MGRRREAGGERRAEEGGGCSGRTRQPAHLDYSAPAVLWCGACCRCPALLSLERLERGVNDMGLGKRGEKGCVVLTHCTGAREANNSGKRRYRALHNLRSPGAHGAGGHGALSARSLSGLRGRDWISVLRVSRPPRGRARAMGGAPACLPACLPWASGPEVARLRTAPLPSSAVSRDGTA